ncbi:MAG: site-2 protease family protein, partial [Isosphaeraceae bacterium]
MDSLNTILNILKVALGLGFVIFLHELGHFLLAKWNGVKVEKFSIGFGPTLLGFTKGETEYVIAALPLGGFVKMLGEGPEEEANKSTDPRAYPNKSVSARMAIISAGVIMNLILGLVCFVYAYGQGREEVPARVGGVLAGSPAFEAGMRSGDHIVAIDDRRDLTYNNLTLKVRLSGKGQLLRFVVERPGTDDPLTFAIEPRRAVGADHPGIGIYPVHGLTFLDPPLISPAGLSSPYPADLFGLKPGDKIVAVGPVGEEPTPISDSLGWEAIISRHRDKPLTVIVAPASKEGTSTSPNRSVELPVNHFVDFGFRLEADAISAIRAGSPAEKAGMRKGDRIVKVDGDAEFDPMRLPSLIQERAGSPVTIEVERPEPGSKPRLVSFTVTPDDTPPWVELAYPNEPLEVSGLGLAYPVRPKIVAVAPGSPAEKAGLKAGDFLSAMTLPAMKIGEEETEAVELTFGPDEPAWAFAWQLMQLRPLAPISLTVNNATSPITVTPEPVSDWYHPQRGEQFQLLFQKMPPLGAQAALHRGLEDTDDNILSIYALFRSLSQ